MSRPAGRGAPAVTAMRTDKIGKCGRSSVVERQLPNHFLDHPLAKKSNNFSILP
jgi:hypothetical protein